jgi:ATP-binding cassette subfamily B protein
MAWGGVPGSPMGGGSAVSQSAAAGLPFAGIPEELAERAQAILDSEPPHPDPDVVYRPRVQDERPLTLRRFLAPHRWGLAGAMALVVIETIAAQAGPLLTQIGIDRGIEAGNRSVLVAVGIAYLGAIVLSVGAGSVRVAWTGRLGERLTYLMRVRVFAHLQRLSMNFYTEEKAGRLMSRMTSDIDALTALFQEGLVNLAVQALTLVVIATILFLLNPMLATITLLAVVPLMMLLTLWFRSASDRGYEAVRDRIADVLSDLQESLAGIRLVTAHNRRRHNVVVHDNIVGSYRDANLFTSRIGAVYGPSTEAIGVAAQALILLIGGSLVRDGQLSVGELTAFLLYVTAFFAPIQALVQLYTTYQQGQAAMGKLRELLATEPGVLEAADATDLPSVAGAIELTGVEFGYGDGPSVLRDVDLRIEAGETFALVGPTGAGKSTIAKLVTRFYDPRAGSVSIDGVDLRTVTQASLRRQLGVVPQEPFLFGGSFRDNIAFARPDATDEDVLATCRDVGIEEMITALPDGLHTIVHERGATLSAGERQLVALARAFFARPRVLILDEATSNLDLRSESTIERALDAVVEGRTAIIIAHRLATALRADRLAVVDDGGIIEIGAPDELIAAGGRFAAMHETWSADIGSAMP